MKYDLIIIGAGPAGLTASIYASRYRIKHFVIARDLGGAMAWAAAVENYPGFKKISGLDLTEKMVSQVRDLEAEIKLTEVTSLAKIKKGGFKVKTVDGRVYQSRSLILATGTQRKQLGVTGEKQYLGKGVGYCATCDAPFFKNKTAAVVGGANAAVMSACHLSRFAEKVFLIYRKKPLRAEPIWRERAENNAKIEIIYRTQVKEIIGDGQKVTGARLDRPYRKQKQLALDGVFIEIGGRPGTELAKELGVALDKKAYIKVNWAMATNIDGFFAAGDIANAAGELQQIVTACSEGAIAATSVYRYLNNS